MATSSEENANGVIIRLYVESTKTRSKKKKREQFDVRINAETHHFNHRRALLLAYSQNLRKSKSEKVPSPQLIHQLSKPIIKTKVVSYQPVRICSCSPSMETIPSLTILARKELKEKQGDNLSEKRNSTYKNSPPFLGKMKKILKQLSCKEIY